MTSTCIPIRSFLESETAARLLDARPAAAFVVCRRYWRNNIKIMRRLAEEHGAECLDNTQFAFAGGQVRSLLSLISYLGTGGEPRVLPRDEDPGEQPPPGWNDAARAFAGGLADRLIAAGSPAVHA